MKHLQICNPCHTYVMHFLVKYNNSLLGSQSIVMVNFRTKTQIEKLKKFMCLWPLKSYMLILQSFFLNIKYVSGFSQMHLWYPLDQKSLVRYSMNHGCAIITKLYIAVKFMYTQRPISHLHNSAVKKHLSTFVQHFILLCYY